MGRPLNKKYFGNRNIGTNGTSDNGIGGEGVASVTIAGTNNNYIAVPTATFADPTLPGGVTATAGTITMVVKSVSITNAGGSYIDEEVVTLGDGSLPDGNGTVDGTYTTRASFRIKSVDVGGEVLTIELVNGGSYTVLAYNGSTAASAPGSTITEMYTTGGTGNNLRVGITWGVLAVAVNEKGSGYVSPPAITMAGNATKTAVLTTDSGSAGTSTNQENAIVAYAYIPASGQPGYISGTGGSSSVVADIVKQKNDRRYVVETAQGIGVCQLVTDGAANAQGEMTITATDQESCTYYVAKLTSRKAVLVPYGAGSHQFPLNSDGTAKTVKWTFGAAVAPVNGTEAGVVTIENA